MRRESQPIEIQGITRPMPRRPFGPALWREVIAELLDGVTARDLVGVLLIVGVLYCAVNVAVGRL